jgi:hypothetical protein
MLSPEVPMLNQVKHSDVHALPRARRLSIPAVLGLVGALSLGACTLRGSGTEQIDQRELDSFHAIDLGGAFELVVHVAPESTQKVVVSSDDNIVPRILTTVSGGELDLSVDHWMVRPQHEMKVEIWVPSLTKIDASGASKIQVDGLHGELFELELSGASDSTLSGIVDRFVVESSGATELDARGLEAKTVELELSGAGNAEVLASERLDAEVSGAGNVRYFGEPTQVTKDVSGAGSVEPG